MLKRILTRLILANLFILVFIPYSFSEKIINHKNNIKNKVSIVEELKILNAHTGGINSLSLNYDDSFLLSGGNDGKVIIWNLKDYSHKIIADIDEEITSVSFSNKNNFISYGGRNKQIFLYDKNLTLLNKINTKSNVSSLNFSSDDKLLIYALDDGTIHFFDLKTMKESKSINLDLFYPNNIILDKNNNTLFVSGYTNKIVLIDLDKLIVLKEIKLKLNQNINSISYLKSNTIFASTDTGEIFYINFEKDTQEKIDSFGGNNITINSFENYLFTGGDFSESKIKIFDINKKVKIYEYYSHNSDINSIIFFKNKKILITTSTDRTIKMWKLNL